MFENEFFVCFDSNVNKKIFVKKKYYFLLTSVTNVVCKKNGFKLFQL